MPIADYTKGVNLRLYYRKGWRYFPILSLSTFTSSFSGVMCSYDPISKLTMHIPKRPAATHLKNPWAETSSHLSSTAVTHSTLLPVETKPVPSMPNWWAATAVFSSLPLDGTYLLAPAPGLTPCIVIILIRGPCEIALEVSTWYPRDTHSLEVIVPIGGKTRRSLPLTNFFSHFWM